MVSTPDKEPNNDLQYDYLQDEEPDDAEENEVWFDTEGDENGRIVAKRRAETGWKNMAEQARENIPDDTGPNGGN